MVQDLSDEELDEIIKKIDQALITGLVTTDKDTRDKLAAVYLYFNSKATAKLVDLTRDFANSTRKLEKLTWALIILTAILVLKELGII